jgi:hypothetical protein
MFHPNKTLIADDTEPTKGSVPNEPKSLLDWFEYLQYITDKLTLQRMLTVVLFGVLLSVALVAFENRDRLFDAAISTISQPDEIAPWSVSAESKKTINDFIRQNNLVGIAIVSEVDLKRNKKTPRYWYIDDETTSSEISQQLSSVLPQAMFDYDPKNTQQMVAVLNNEFDCTRYQDTLYNRLFPSLSEKYPVVCRIAIPPFYGRFVGMLTFGLTTNPTKSEVDALRIEASRIAVEMYLRDVLHKTK